MKKFLFIIPKVPYKIKVFILIFYSSIKLNAQTSGCHVSYMASERIYYTPYPEGGNNAYITTGVVDESGATGGYRGNESVTYGCIMDVGAGCTVFQQYLTSGGSIDTRIYKTGTSASISPENCSIDDFLPALFIFTASIAFCKLIKPRLVIKINENNHHHSSL